MLRRFPRMRKDILNQTPQGFVLKAKNPQTNEVPMLVEHLTSEKELVNSPRAVGGLTYFGNRKGRISKVFFNLSEEVLRGGFPLAEDHRG